MLAHHEETAKKRMAFGSRTSKAVDQLLAKYPKASVRNLRGYKLESAIREMRQRQRRRALGSKGSGRTQGR